MNLTWLLIKSKHFQLNNIKILIWSRQLGVYLVACCNYCDCEEAIKQSSLRIDESFFFLVLFSCRKGQVDKISAVWTVTWPLYWRCMHVLWIHFSNTIIEKKRRNLTKKVNKSKTVCLIQSFHSQIAHGVFFVQ